MPRRIDHSPRRGQIGSEGQLVAAERDDHHGALIAPHDHDFLEIALVTAGSGVHLSREGEHVLRRGDFVVVRPGQWHAYLGAKDLRLFNCFVAPELLDGALSHLEDHVAFLRALRAPPHVGPLPPVTLAPADLHAAVAHLEAIGGRLSRRAPTASALGRLLQFIDILDRPWRTSTAAAGTLRRLHPASSRAIELMEADLAHPWTLGELAALVSVERTNLVRVFRSSTGLPPIAYLHRRRAQVASSLLMQTSLPLAAIAKKVGWADPNYFSRRFRSELGLSPSAYRRRVAPADAQGRP